MLDKQFLTLRDLSKYLQVSVPTIWRWRRDDATFPKPFRPTAQTVLFDQAEIEVWLDASRGE